MSFFVYFFLAWCGIMAIVLIAIGAGERRAKRRDSKRKGAEREEVGDQADPRV
jgi:hypothetical protein